MADWLPSANYIVGSIGDATAPDGSTKKVVYPGAVLMDPTTGDALGTAGNPLVTSGGGGAGGSAVHGPDATGVAPTQPPVLIAGVNASGDVSTFKCLDGVSQSISEQIMDQPMGVYGTVILGIDPSTDAVPFNVDANGNLITVPVSAQFWMETITPLAASATFNGASRDAGAASPGPVAGAYFNGFFLSDQTGTASLQCSDDGATWVTCATDVLAAATPLILQVPVTAQYHRVVLANGGTPQSSVMVRSSYTAA